jgi:hypothetical protein
MDNGIDSELYKEIPVEKEDTGDVLMDKPFNPSLINIDRQTPALYNIISRLKSNPPEIDLYPDFQRKDDLWDKGKQSRLIESILIEFPLPAFYFDGTDDNKWLVVDGLQRLSALRNFAIDKSENRLILQDMEFLKNLEGKTFDGLNGLDRVSQRKIEEAQITAYIIKPGTPDEVKFNLFRRINTGGLELQPQEIRHALNQGLPANTVAELANSVEFKKATENKISSERMLDREFVNRFVAFYLNEPETYTPDLESFLNKSMAQIANLSQVQLNKMKSDFTQAMKYANLIFGNWAFRKADLYPKTRKPISKTLFEIWSVNLAKLSNQQRENLLSRKTELIKAFVEMMKTDDKFKRSISSATGRKLEVVERFSKIKTLISQFV